MLALTALLGACPAKAPRSSGPPTTKWSARALVASGPVTLGRPVLHLGGQWPGGLALGMQGGVIAVPVARAKPRVLLFSPGTLRPLRAIAVASPVQRLALSRDGAQLALVVKRRIQIRRVRDGSLLHTVAGRFPTVKALAFAGGGRLLLVATGKQLLAVDTTSGAVRYSVSAARLGSKGSSIEALAVAPGGRRIAVGGWATLALLDVDSGRLLRAMQQPGTPVRAVGFSADGARLVATDHRAAGLWNVARGQRVQTLKPPGDWLAAAAISPDGRWLALGSHDGRLSLWDLARSRWAARVRVGAMLRGFGFLGGARLVVDEQYAVRLWDMARLARGERDDLLGQACALQPLPDGRHLVVADCHVKHEERESTLQLWDLRRGHVVRSWAAHPRHVDVLALSHGGSLLASASRSGQVRLWRLPGGERVEQLGGEARDVSTLAFDARDAQLLVAGENDNWRKTGYLELVALESHQVRLALELPDGRGVAALSPDGTRLFYPAGKGKLALRSVVAGDPPRVLSLPAKRLYYPMAVAPAGQRLAMASGDSGLVELLLRPRLRVRQLEQVPPSGQCEAAAYASDGALAGLCNGQLVVWRHGRRVLQLPRRNIKAMGWLCGGRVLVTGNADGTLGLWPVPTGGGGSPD